MRFSSIARLSSILYSIVKKPQIVSEEQMVFKLAGGTHCDLKKSAEFRPSDPATTFSDIGRDGSARTSDLARKSVQLVFRKYGGGSVNCQRKLMAFFPHFKRLKALHFGVLRLSVDRKTELKANRAVTVY